MSNSHGGRREGSGRPKSEDVKLIRVPLSKIDTVLAVRDPDYQHTIPLYSSKVAAGYPSAVDDSIDECINLQEFLVRKPSKTFAVTASGESMIDAGIKSGDMLIVDSSLPGKSGQIVIAVVNGELTVKFLSIRANLIYLLPANPLFSPIEVSEEADFRILGVVVHVIHTI